MIKTFERRTQLHRLIRSIRRYYPTVRILVVDDSKIPITLPGVEVLHLPYDSGVSVGRTEGIKRIHTRFFLNLDDDFVLYKGSNIVRALETLNDHPQVDIIGGYLINLPFFRKSGPGGKIGYTTKDRILPLKSEVAGLQVYDKVPQFYVGRTDTVKRCGWDTAIKRLDHGVFFGRAKGNLVTLYDPAIGVLHARTPFNRHYMSKRYDFADDLKILKSRNNTGELSATFTPH